MLENLAKTAAAPYCKPLSNKKNVQMSDLIKKVEIISDDEHDLRIPVNQLDFN